MQAPAGTVGILPLPLLLCVGQPEEDSNPDPHLRRLTRATEIACKSVFAAVAVQAAPSDLSRLSHPRAILHSPAKELCILVTRFALTRMASTETLLADDKEAATENEALNETW